MNPLDVLKIGIIIVISLFILMIFHLVVGFLGMQYFFGTLIALMFAIFCIYFKFSLPLTVGTFFGIIYVLEWHWFFAIILTLPGIFFLSPNKFKKTFNVKTFKTGYDFKGKEDFSKNAETLKTNVKNTDIIDGEYKILNEDNEKKK